MAARGIAAKLLMWQETTFGVTPGSPAAELMYFRTCNVSGVLARLIDETISGRRGLPRSIIGNKDVSGTIMTTLAPQSAMRWLANLIGTPVTTGASAPYTHTFSLSGALPVSFGLEIDWGSSIGTPGRYTRFLGCRIAKGSFKFGSSGFVDASFDIRGADFDLTQIAPIDASPDDYGHAGNSMFTATITEGGSPIATVQDLTIEWDNDLDDSQFVIGGGGKRGGLDEGFAKLSGSLTALFADTTLINKGVNSTDTALTLALQHGTGVGTAGNEKMTFAIPYMLYDVKTPGIDGPKGIKQQLAFNAHRNSTAELAANVVILSARAAL